MQAVGLLLNNQNSNDLVSQAERFSRTGNPVVIYRRPGVGVNGLLRRLVVITQIAADRHAGALADLRHRFAEADRFLVTDGTRDLRGRSDGPDRQLNCLMFTGSLGLGGAEQWIRILTNESRHSWRVLVSPNNSSSILTDRMTAPILSWGVHEKNIRSFPTQQDAMLAATDDVDVVVCWGGTMNTPLPGHRPSIDVIQGLVELEQRTRQVGVAHGCTKWSKRMVSDAFMTNLCTHFVAVSETVAESCPPGTTVILNGIDVGRLEHGSQDEARRRFGLPTGGKVAGYIGRLSPDKNCEPLAAAVNLLPDEWTSFFCGNGYGRENSVEMIEADAGQRAIIHPAIPDVGNAFIASDVLVMLSPSEGCSLGVLEAWHLGVPVVSTRVGAIPEIEREVGPVVVPLPINPTPAQIAEAILQADPASDVTQRAKLWAQLHGTSDVMVRKWDDYLVKICQEVA